MEVRNQRTAQSLLASCSPLLRSRSFGATTLPPRPMSNCWKARTGRCWRREREETTILFSFFQAGFLFSFWATEGNEEGRAGEDMQCTRCFRLILPVARTSIYIYIMKACSNVSRVSLACLFLTEPVCRRGEEAYRFYVLAFNSHAKKNIFYIHQLDLQVNVL